MKNIPFQQAEVALKYDSFPEALLDPLLRLRSLIFSTARECKEAGKIAESLKWGEPSYATVHPKSGSPIRLGHPKGDDHTYAMYFICSTSLVNDFRLKYGPLFKFEGNRAILFALEDDIPVKELQDCIRMALTYFIKGGVYGKSKKHPATR